MSATITMSGSPGRQCPAAIVTIWFGERGSPAYYRGTLSEDDNKLTGAWHYPGGGYEAISTRVR